MKCQCHPESPFHWARSLRPSIFAKDPTFKPKTPQTYAHLTKEENALIYHQFSIHSRAKPMVKPTQNKHEV